MAPHATNVIWPFPLFSNDFHAFPTISNDFSFQPTSHAHWNPQFSIVQHPWKFYNPYVAHWHIKVVRTCQWDHFGIESVWRFRHTVEVMWLLNRCYELDMVVLDVGLSCASPVLCKIYQLSAFHFKISHYIYSNIFIHEAQFILCTPK